MPNLHIGTLTTDECIIMADTLRERHHQLEDCWRDLQSYEQKLFRAYTDLWLKFHAIADEAREEFREEW